MCKASQKPVTTIRNGHPNTLIHLQETSKADRSSLGLFTNLGTNPIGALAAFMAVLLWNRNFDQLRKLYQNMRIQRLTKMLKLWRLFPTDIDMLIYIIGALGITFITAGFVVWSFVTKAFEDNENLRFKPLEEDETEQ